MPLFIRKDGEKTILLNKCGESLFGCSGAMLVTQGIYTPKSLTSSSLYVCKRTVWVPDSLSCGCLVNHLESFGVTLPFSVQKVSSFHRFGLCGINPTRTVHAIDKHFFLLAKIPYKHFVIYGIVEIKESNPSGAIVIKNISASKNDVLHHVDWIQNDITLYHQKPKKRRRRLPTFLSEPMNDHRVHSFITESESTTVREETHKDPVQLETESNTSISTAHSPVVSPSEYVNSSGPSLNGVYLPSPHPIYLIPFTPLPNVSEAAMDSNPFFISSQPSWLAKPNVMCFFCFIEKGKVSVKLPLGLREKGVPSFISKALSSHDHRMKDCSSEWVSNFKKQGKRQAEEWRGKRGWKVNWLALTNHKHEVSSIGRCVRNHTVVAHQSVVHITNHHSKCELCTPHAHHLAI